MINHAMDPVEFEATPPSIDAASRRFADQDVARRI
jgi:hypothetical protein